MYDELVKDLRICAEGEHCDKCGKWEMKQNGGRNACEYAICTEAADAIEELLTLKALADEKIERLENAKSKKKRPPKRLPCTCGRKKLELWWSNEGWFLKCPNCGRESQPERYQSHVNSVWNNGLPKPPKKETE